MQPSSLPKRDAFLLAMVFMAIVLLHRPLLALPYFWDEAGHYIPAARDFLLSGDVIPKTTISNAHPPLPQVYLALAWTLFGYAPTVTRVAMLLIAAFGLVQVFRIAERVANREIATAATLLTALYPVVFAQSSLAHADVMATALALCGLRLYLRRSPWAFFALSLAVLAKETAVLFPLVLFAWEFATKRHGAGTATVRGGSTAEPVPSRSAFSLLVPVAVLGCWFAYHYVRTGYVFGNPEFFRYNLGTTFVPLRIALAALRRVWQVTGYMNLWVLTLSMATAMLLPPLRENGDERPRIAVPTQLLFLALILAHVVGHSLVGGAVLARYMMPALPLVIIIAVSTLWRRVPRWRLLSAFCAIAFIIGWWVPPITSFAPEDNLHYAAYVRLHQRASAQLAQRYPKATVLTAWPASDELSHPYLGYTGTSHKIVRLEDFSFNQLMLAKQNVDYDVALLFSTKTPRSRLRWAWWESANARFFDLHEDLTPATAALILGGRVVYSETEDGQWVAILEIDRAHNAD